MRRGLLLLLASLVAIAGTDLRTGASRRRQDAEFKSGIDLVTVTATVRDRKGRLVKGLESQDFEVFDNGERAAITDFRAEPSPVSLAILFDISGSMRVADRMLAARFAAHHVLSWLEPGRDEAALFTFDSRLHEVAPFTVDTRALQGALGEVDPFGATSLHDAIAEAAQRAADAHRPPPGGRGHHRRHRYGQRPDAGAGVGRSPARSTCRCTSSRPSCRSITRAARRRSRSQSARQRGRHRRGPRAWTGGAFFYASTPADTSNAARQVLEELRAAVRHRVRAGRRPTGWRPLEIRTRDKDHIVRARSGYMAGPRAAVAGGHRSVGLLGGVHA